jgi:hypothetical protein
MGSSRIFKASLLAAAPLLVTSQLVLAQYPQQGPKLVGIGAARPNPAEKGFSVALTRRRRGDGRIGA